MRPPDQAKPRPFRGPLAEELRALEQELGLPLRFTTDLKKDSDWAFVIKMHALIEGGIAHLLEHKLAKPELRDFLNRLSLRGRVGKVGLARALEVLHPDDARFLEAFGDLRNDYAHNLRNANLPLVQYIQMLTPGHRQRFLAPFHLYLAKTIKYNEKQLARDDFVANHPKQAIWLVAIVVLSSFYRHKEMARIHTETVRNALEAWDRIDAM
jgi:hypothetical protein